MRCTDQHRSLQATVRRFIDERVDPFDDGWEATEILPTHEFFSQACALGLVGITKPDACGGLGLDFSYAVAAAVGWGHERPHGVGMAIGVQTDMAPALTAIGADPLRRELLAPAVAGYLVKARGVSEAGAGRHPLRACDAGARR